VIPKLTPEVLEKIEKILGNLPEAAVRIIDLCGSFCWRNCFLLNGGGMEGRFWISLGDFQKGAGRRT